MAKKKRLLFGTAALFCLLPLVCPAASLEPKTIARTEDPVVILPQDLPMMKDAVISRLALFAFGEQGFAAIPFQVDERGKDGKFVYLEGPKANPEDGDQRFNGKDELVFMLWDAGDRAPEDAALPCRALRAAELTIIDPLNPAGKAWVYLAECKDSPPRSDKDYVRNEYDGKHDWVKTDRYHFAEQRGNSYFDRLALKGDDGEVGPNLVDRIKGRGKITALGGLIKIETPESDLKGSIQAWIDGPVRVVHLMTAYIQFTVIKLNIGGQAENLFYPNYFVTPIQVNMPINPGTVLSSFVMRYAIDWRAEFEGSRYYDPVNAKGVVLDGKMSAEEKAMDYKTGHDWYALTGPRGNLVVRMVIPEQWEEVLPRRLYYVDDITALDPPEDDPGQRCPGFLLDAMADIPAGKYKYYLYYMVPEKDPPASVPALMNILDHPVKVKARALAGSD